MKKPFSIPFAAIEFLQYRSERLSVASSRNTETGVYLRVNEDFEYRIGVNYGRAVGSARSLISALGRTDSIETAHFSPLKALRVVENPRLRSGYDCGFRLGARRTWGVEAKMDPSKNSFCPMCRPIAEPMGQKAGVHEVRRSQKWDAAVNLQPTLPKSDRLLAVHLLKDRIASIPIKSVLPLLFGALLSSTYAAQSLIPAQSEITFTSKQMGVPVQGRFKRFDAQVAFDPHKLDASRVGFTIDLGSVALGVKETEAELAKPEWFHVQQFPKATFASTTIKAVGAGQFEVKGQLKIKGVGQNLVIPVTVTTPSAAGVSQASGSFAIKRLDFKIGSGEWGDTSIVADEVQVQFKLGLTGVPPM
jgi:polyisoprenoid-binding protein YceI